MILAALALGACAPVDLSDVPLPPGRMVYELAPPAMMAGMQVAETWSAGPDGRLHFHSVGSYPAASSTMEMDNVSWFGLLSHRAETDRVYNRDDLTALARLAPGETVEIRVSQAVQMRQGPHLVDTVNTVRHLGCRTRDVLGLTMEVHAYEVTYQNIRAQGQNVHTTEDTFIREFSPVVGWWVAQSGEMGDLVLVEAEP